MEFITKTRIVKGWSSDQKFCVTDETGARYLYRVSDINEYEKKRVEFTAMQNVAALGVPMCLPLKFGTNDDSVYSLQTWIDGEDAEAVVPAWPENRQYQCGVEAGRILAKIHTIPAPAEREDWERFFNRKTDKKIQNYLACPIKYPHGQAFIDCTERSRHLLKSRPQTYQHGDYHIGNMMIGRDGRLYIIDFNRNDYGDPWEEFNRIVWCAQKAPRFACGMVDGYFDGPVPTDFWRLLALYIASNALSSLPWAIPFGQKQVDIMLKQARDILSWHDGMKSPIPTWYAAHSEQ